MKILNTNLVCNTYTNYLYELEIEVDDISPLSGIAEAVLSEDEDSKYVYGETPDGFITFGSISKKASHGHDAEYRWSSRASIFNSKFGKHCIEVTLIYTKYGFRHCFAAAMTIDAILPYIPDDFYIIEQVETDSHGNIKEISYYISNFKHEEEQRWYFVDAIYSNGSERYIRNRIFKGSIHPDLSVIASAYRRGLMDNYMLRKACKDIASSGKYSLYELSKFASYMEENFAMIQSLKFFNDNNHNISFSFKESVIYNSTNNNIYDEDEIIIEDDYEESPDDIPYPDRFPYMSRQSIVENILDMWLVSSEMDYIKEFWLGFWKDPLKYKNSALPNMIVQDIREHCIA